MGGIIRDIQLRLRIGEEGSGRVVTTGELRRGEEKRVVIELGEKGHVSVA